MAKTVYIRSAEGQNASPIKEEKNEELQASLVERVDMYLAQFSKLSVKDKVTFFRLFASMTNAGINILKALEILKNQVTTPRLKLITVHLEMRIKKGSTLSDALADFPKDFGDAEIGMIRAGEVSGKLNITLSNLAEQMEKSESLTKKLKGAMIYPTVVIILMIGALFAVMTFVIPQLKDMFDSFHTKLPIVTQALIDFSDFMVAYGGPLGLPNVINIIIGIIILVFGIGYYKTTDSGKYHWDALMLRLPIFGILNQKVVIAKFCRGLATLLSSGVPIVKTIAICASIVGNEAYKRRIMRIADDVKRGISITDNLRGDTQYFPAMLTSMIGVGEQTAQLDKTSLKMAEFYEDEADDMIKNISALLEPIIIVVVGLAVGGLVVAVMLPIMSLSDLASGG